jgi:hypothetical protein
LVKTAYLIVLLQLAVGEVAQLPMAMLATVALVVVLVLEVAQQVLVVLAYLVKDLQVVAEQDFSQLVVVQAVAVTAALV